MAQETGLTVDDTKDAIFELSSFFRTPAHHILVEASLYTEFDRHWMPWNPANDALRLAADILNNPDFPSTCSEIAELYGWPPRRLNPAITYLLDRGMLYDMKAMGTQPLRIFHVTGREDPLRRLVKSRQ